MMTRCLCAAFFLLSLAATAMAQAPTYSLHVQWSDPNPPWMVAKYEVGYRFVLAADRGSRTTYVYDTQEDIADTSLKVHVIPFPPSVQEDDRIAWSVRACNSVGCSRWGTEQYMDFALDAVVNEGAPPDELPSRAPSRLTDLQGAIYRD